MNTPGTDNNNISIGMSALSDNNTGSSCTAIGTSALMSNNIDAIKVHTEISIRFNANCIDKESEGALCWIVTINDEDFLCENVQVSVPTKTISRIIGGVKKWCISCSSNNFKLEENVFIIS